ncbi:hypothetical protein MN210_08475 [Psychrobacter raelei]|uniref:Tetratricopeptide repeat protein n=1 Tax=Psychrobacter raelei TaxID=2565531 RepID=A0AAT9PCS1_9GAMM
MAPRQPKTKEDALIDIGNELINLLTESKGLEEPDYSQLDNLKAEAYKNLDGGPAKYWAILSFIESLKLNYTAAYSCYQKAWKLGKDNRELMVNYPALLFRMNRFDELFSEAKRYLRSYPSMYQPIVHLLATSYLLLDTDELEAALELFQEKDEAECSLVRQSRVVINAVPKVIDNLNEIDLDTEVYVDSMKYLNGFISSKTLETYHLRISIEDKYDQFVRVEVFLEITPKQAIELNKQFDSSFIEHVIISENLSALEKFIVYFKPIDDNQNKIESAFVLDNKELLES